MDKEKEIYSPPLIEIINIETESIIANSDPTGTIPEVPWGGKKRLWEE